jgi:hypothetical protein
MYEIRNSGCGRKSGLQTERGPGAELQASELERERETERQRQKECRRESWRERAGGGERER